RGLLSEWGGRFVKTAVDNRSEVAELGHRSAAPLESTGLKIELARRYKFAASHRLHTDKFSEEENVRVFGKCANPYGHGHNYVLEISVSGDVDPATGMIANLADLDAFVQREVLDAFDCRSLNQDVAAFRDVVPTTENLCVEIFE